MQFGRAIRSATQTAIYVPVRARPHFATRGLPRFEPQKGECVPEAARKELVHLIVSCGAGSRDFWRRSIGLAAQVHGTFGAGVVFGDRPAPPQAIESCFAAQVPTTFPHLRQSSISPAPKNTVACANPSSHLRQSRCIPKSLNRSATRTAIYASVRAQPHSAEPGSSTIQATEGRMRARGCKGRAGTPDCVLWRRFTGLLAQVYWPCGAGPRDFWRRSIGLAAQVYWAFGAGVVFGDRPAPPQAVESCFAAQVPTTFPHLHQSSISPAPENTVTCAKRTRIHTPEYQKRHRTSCDGADNTLFRSTITPPSSDTHSSPFSGTPAPGTSRSQRCGRDGRSGAGPQGQATGGQSR